MRSYAITSIIYTSILDRELNALYGLKLGEFKILCIVDSEQRLNKTGFCTSKNIFEYSEGVKVNQNHFLKQLNNLINKGFIENLGKRKYKLVITGTGDHVIREFVKSLNNKVRAKEQQKSKRLKYSYLDLT